MKHASTLPSRGTSSSAPPVHRLSHSIAKAAAPPPRKIRIIHVLAPEVIKTEARHFRELVQRLTGKPPPHQKGSCAASASASASTGGDASPSSTLTSVSSFDTAGDDGVLGGAGGAAAAGIEIMKVADTSSSPSSGGEGEGGGFLRALELDGYDGGFYQGLDDSLFNPCDMHGRFYF